MRRNLRRGVTLGVIVLTALLGAGAALASADDEQVVDISKQLVDMDKKMAELQEKGKSAREGEFRAAADCGFGDPSQVFASWGDTADYSLIPQGDLSDLSRWSLDKDVAFSTEDDPFTPGTGSLVFSKGGEAVTPVMCVNLDHPTMRLFLADRGGNGKAHLEVKVIYEGLDGKVHDLKVAKLKVDESWQPSVVVPIGVNRLSAASASGWTPVAFEFKVHGLQKGETFVVGGVYVDPCQSR